MNSLEQEIAELEQKLHALDSERATVAQTLATLKQQRQQQVVV
jgi:chorismate mutase